MRTRKYPAITQKKFKKLYNKVFLRLKKQLPLTTAPQLEMAILIDHLAQYELLKEEFITRWFTSRGSKENV